ncbi:peptidoglycan DD-metalloendopeptidase family protein [Nanchangia anserum]|uniref:peptidoglycan DD-metalloendopeptidase family protein n=1 Tax=Nanchangia anserum TaxID=2692125 RepID=UPI0018842068|nr:peptidoglycan DD-metalloendopeptidase family protein [Nanchangia anserum]QOX81925.1 peptidoglycan DD-metalloendopeptidase family protein [Nanchangia anserum]
MKLATIFAPTLCLASCVFLPAAAILNTCQAHATTTTMTGFDPGTVPPAYVESVKKAGSICAPITPALIAAQVEAESNWNPNATSSAGARGISQFMPSTWASSGLDGDGDGKADITNPADAIYSQGHLMCDLYERMNSWAQSGKISLGTYSITDLALAAYNAGEGAVAENHGVPPYGQTLAYIPKINDLAKKYGATITTTASTTQATKAAKLTDPNKTKKPTKTEGEGQDAKTNASGGVGESGWDGSFSPPKTGSLSITSPFGYRIHPLTGAPKLHQGVDLASPTGEAQFATAPGVVYEVKMVQGCGNWVRIRHGSFGGHEWTTTHCHLSVPEAKVGQHVRAGDEIGKTGSTGAVTGPHVHYQIERDGQPIDPMPFIEGKTATATGTTAAGSSDGAGLMNSCATCSG